jgi:hypothetical protein
MRCRRSERSSDRLKLHAAGADRLFMAFETGLFLLRTESWLPEGTPAWAECAVDLMDQPIARLHHLSPDGYGKDTYGWNDDLWLRFDRMSGTVQLVLEEDGEWMVEVEADVDDDLWNLFVEIRGGDVPEGFDERILPLLLGATGPKVSAAALDDAAVEHFDALPIMSHRSVADERGQRGFWVPQEPPG